MAVHRQDQRRGIVKKKTYTKKWVTIILSFGLVGGMAPYLLAVFGLEGYEELGERWVECILGVGLGYFLKSFFETRQEKKQRLEDWQAGLSSSEQEGEGNG